MERVPLQSRHGRSASLDWWSDPALYKAMERMTTGRRRPIPGVLDTSCVRTGLAHQLKTGVPPASLSAARDGTVRLFMERDTLNETCRRLSRFAQQLDVPISHLADLFDREWLPHIRVVALPPALRALDTRAVGVRSLDADDYPAAALAALLSPCALLTHDRKHFGPLGIQSSSQGVDAVIAAIDVKVGEVRLHAVAAMPRDAARRGPLRDQVGDRAHGSCGVGAHCPCHRGCVLALPAPAAGEKDGDQDGRRRRGSSVSRRESEGSSLRAAVT
jgi:hypothetical protein